MAARIFCAVPYPTRSILGSFGFPVVTSRSSALQHRISEIISPARVSALKTHLSIIQIAIHFGKRAGRSGNKLSTSSLVFTKPMRAQKAVNCFQSLYPEVSQIPIVLSSIQTCAASLTGGTRPAYSRRRPALMLCRDAP